MRSARLLATLTAVLGLGLLSGSLTQVAALDGDLERAAKQRPMERVVETEDPRCGRDHAQPTRWRES